MPNRRTATRARRAGRCRSQRARSRSYQTSRFRTERTGSSHCRTRSCVSSRATEGAQPRRSMRRHRPRLLSLRPQPSKTSPLSVRRTSRHGSSRERTALSARRCRQTPTAGASNIWRCGPPRGLSSDRVRFCGGRIGSGGSSSSSRTRDSTSGVVRLGGVAPVRGGVVQRGISEQVSLGAPLESRVVPCHDSDSSP